MISQLPYLVKENNSYLSFYAVVKSRVSKILCKVKPKKSSNILISRIISSFVFPFQLTADFCKLKINDNLLIKKKKKAQNLLCSFSLNGIQTTLAPSFCSSTQKFHHNRTTWLMETIILTMKHCVVSFTTITGSQSVRTYWAIIG